MAKEKSIDELENVVRSNPQPCQQLERGKETQLWKPRWETYLRIF